MKPTSSFFDRVIANPRRFWLKMGFILLLFVLPLAIAFAEGNLIGLFKGGAWRGIFLPPVVIAYILLISPGMARVEADVLKSFRSLVLLDDESFDQLVHRIGNINPRKEILIFSIGGFIGLLMIFGTSDRPLSFSWIALEWFMANGLEYGLLAWVIYGSLVGTRLTATMLRQPLRVDPFDISPFEPIGRQSLLLALVFAGGILLSLVFIGIQVETLQRLDFWLIYIPTFAIPVVIFFLSMNPTHKVLAAAKEREQKAVQAHFERSCRELLQCIDQHKDTGRLPAEINALVAYSQGLQMARTWPYNTTMFRTLVFSVLIPSGTALARIIGELIFNNNQIFSLFR